MERESNYRYGEIVAFSPAHSVWVWLFSCHLFIRHKMLYLTTVTRQLAERAQLYVVICSCNTWSDPMNKENLLVKTLRVLCLVVQQWVEWGVNIITNGWHVIVTLCLVTTMLSWYHHHPIFNNNLHMCVYVWYGLLLSCFSCHMINNCVTIHLWHGFHH